VIKHTMAKSGPLGYVAPLHLPPRRRTRDIPAEPSSPLIFGQPVFRHGGDVLETLVVEWRILWCDPRHEASLAQGDGMSTLPLPPPSLPAAVGQVA
jgi:hypothetical protein